MIPRIYLDHAATTPILPAARGAMIEGFGMWANPSSPHRDGRAARAALEDARARIKTALGWTGALIFTSGATEAAALAFRRCWNVGPKPMLSTVEHDAVMRQAPESERVNIGVTCDGLVDPEQLATWLRIAPGGLVAIQHVNSETGVIQPLEQIVEVVDAAGSFLFADCAQSAGKLDLPRADMIAISAHKFGGPPGIGALLVRDLKLLVPQGGQEQGYRGGTENVPAAMGLAAALEVRMSESWPLAKRFEEQAGNRRMLDGIVEQAGGIVMCGTSQRSPYVATYAMPHLSAAAQLINFDALGIAVSAGSACSSGSLRTSSVLSALGVEPDIAARCVRVSFGLDTTHDDVLSFGNVWSLMAGAARERAA